MIDYKVLVSGNNLSLEGGFLGLANITLIESGDGPIVVDTGHYTNRPALIAALESAGYRPADIPRVFLTHLHFDHCNNVDLFSEATIYVGRTEWEYARNPHANDMFVPWLIHEQLARHRTEILEGEGMLCDGVSYFTAPGHTPGCLALRLDGTAAGTVVIAGDAIKYAKEAVTGQCDMAFDELAVGTRSIARILDMADRVVPGHFPELACRDGRVTWDGAAELTLRVR